jgi:hypothetical protein
MGAWNAQGGGGAWRKLEMVYELNQAAFGLVYIGLCHQHPDATPAELRRLWAEVRLGPELAARIAHQL